MGLTDWPNKSRGQKISIGTDLRSGDYTWYLNPKMRVLVKLTKSSGKLLPNNTTNYWANGLQYMYGGINPIMLATEDNGDVSFSISITLQTKNGNTWTSVIDENQGVVIADAESFAYSANNRADGVPVEHIQATIPKTSQWYLIDAPTKGVNGNKLGNNNYIIEIKDKNTTEKTLMMHVNNSAASNVGHASVFYAKGLTQLKNVRQTGAGITGLAIGFFIPTQSSNAPESYGSALHLQEQMNFGAIQPISGYNSINTILNKTNGQLPEIKSQSIVSFIRETLNAPSEYEIDGRNLSLDVNVSAINLDTKDGYIYAWIDANGDGKFSEDESTQVLVQKGTANNTYKISFPNNLLKNAKLGETWIRLRVTSDPLTNTNEDKSNIDSRSYDYASNGEVMDFRISLVNNMDNNSILPVQLISFQAKAIGSQNEIKWVTTNEQNNQYFEVLKSQDGFTQWEIVERVKPNSSQTYLVLDRSIQSPNQYYRLKQVDIDGKETLYAIHKVVNDNKNSMSSIKTYPQPFTSQLYFETTINQSGKYSIEIIGLNGVKLLQQEYSLSVGQHKLQIAGIVHLQRGSYILKFSKGLQNIKSTIIIKQ